MTVEMRYPFGLHVRRGEVYTGSAFDDDVVGEEVGSEIEPAHVGTWHEDNHQKEAFIIVQKGKVFLIVRDRQLERPNQKMTTWLSRDWEAYELPLASEHLDVGGGVI